MKNAKGFIVIAALSFVGVACSNSTPSATDTTPAGSPSAITSSTPPATPTSSAPAAQAISATDALKFDPATITVAVGETVTWNNTGSSPHRVVACTASSGCTAASTIDTSLDSGDIAGGAKYEHAFAAAGTFNYFCKIHGASMAGQVIVQ